MCTPMFIAASFTTAKRWKQPKCPSVNEWMNKTWSIRTVEYYSDLITNEIVLHAMTWMKLEHILSERSQTQKDKYCRISLM